MTQTPGNNDLQQLAQRLQSLQEKTDQALAQASRRATIASRIWMAVIILFALYFSIAWYKIAQFQAKDAAYVLQKHVEDALPQTAADMTRDLKARAPAVIASIEPHVLGAPREIGQMLQQGLEEQVDVGLRQLEGQLYDSAKAQLQSFHMQMQGERNKPLTEAEITVELDKMLNELIADAYRRTDKVLYEYAMQADQILEYLHKLAAGKDLDRREELHRDIIVSFLAMMEKHPLGTLDLDSLTPPQEK